MLTQLEITTPRVVTPDIIFDESGTVRSDPVQIRNIDGLGPVAAALATTPNGVIDGETYNGGTVAKRNIVITFGLNPDWADQTMESLRGMLYKYFMPKNELNLIFHSTHMADCEITGYVESMEPNIFSRDPEVQVSIICPDPYFTAVVESVINGIAVAIDGTPLTEFEYQGTVPTGFILTSTVGALTYTGTVKMVNYAPTLESFSLLTTTISSTLKLVVSTVLGDKYVRNVNTSSGAPTNILANLVQTSAWPQLYPGTNKFGFMTSAATQPWELHYNARYGGI